MTTEREILIASLKGEFQDFEIINIDISVGNDTTAETRSIPAVWICDVWAIHRTFNDSANEWTLSHIPTGLAIHHDTTLAAVLMALGALVASDLPWDMVVTKEDAKRMREGLKEETKRFREILKTIYSLDIPATKEVEEYA